jgi:hypothetical protein
MFYSAARVRVKGVPLRSIIAAALLVLAGCEKDGVNGSDGFDASSDAGPTGPDADVGEQPCNMTGRWIAEQHTTAIALGSPQNTTTWYFYEFTQTGDAFTATRSMNCGLVVDGSTTVTLDDATTETLAINELAGPGRAGTFRLSNDGNSCEFVLDRMYNLRGANKAMYVTNVWNVGDPPRPLSDFPTLPTAPPGMEDWDGDNMHGITLRSGLGNRYVSQRDWNQHSGRVPTFAAQFGGDGVISVEWDTQEGISTQTSPLLRVTATPDGNGWARYARADDTLTVIDTGEHPELDTCRNVQQLASQIW